ncbi:hypothetical protein ACT2FY_13025 [Paraburkholderia fungorum]|uniref:hypothetical protein n=1 Tax=Paraburkholderia fungorum TaxID=134537 RepID=UPI00402B6287
MRLLIEIPDGIGWLSHGRRIGRTRFSTYGKTKRIETTVYRLERVMYEHRGPRFVYADAWIPEHHRGGFIPGDLDWVGDGIYRAKAYVEFNRTTLAPFVASGDLEWDVKEMA